MIATILSIFVYGNSQCAIRQCTATVWGMLMVVHYNWQMTYAIVDCYDPKYISISCFFFPEDYLKPLADLYLSLCVRACLCLELKKFMYCCMTDSVFVV